MSPVSAELSPFHLIDARGDAAGLATWAQVSESLAAGPEGWIAVAGGFDCYVEADESEMRAAFDAWCAS